MTNKSFVDEDWTGYTHEEIQSRIIAEFEEEEQKEIETERRQVSIFLLAILEAVLNEQVKARLISHDTAKYILDAVRDQAIRQGWIN